MSTLTPHFTSTADVRARGPFSPNSYSIKDFGEKGPPAFNPLRVANQIRALSVSQAVTLSPVVEIPTPTLAAHVGTMNVILSWSRTDRMPVSMHQLCYASGIGSPETFYKYTSHPTSRVIQLEKGEKYSWATNSARAGIWKIDQSNTSSVIGAWPYFALSPNNQLWSCHQYGDKAWRFALILYNRFGVQPGMFQTTDVREWTDFSVKTVKTLLSSVNGLYVSRLKLGTYEFHPLALFEQNDDIQPPVPAWMETQAAGMNHLKQNRTKATVDPAGDGQIPDVDHRASFVPRSLDYKALKRVSKDVGIQQAKLWEPSNDK